jgi:hypothetical protein
MFSLAAVVVTIVADAYYFFKSTYARLGRKLNRWSDAHLALDLKVAFLIKSIVLQR